jgi:hypothetical protein
MGFLTSDPLLCVMVITIGFAFGGKFFNIL